MASEGPKHTLAQMWVWLVIVGLVIAVSASVADARPAHHPARKARHRVARRHTPARPGHPPRAGRSGADGVVQVVQTDPALSQFLAPQPSLALSPVQPQGVPVIGVNEQVRYQQFTGLGAAATDSSAWLMFNQISPVTRLALLQDLFGPAGIHLNFLRVPIAASDFTVNGQPYSYDDDAVRPVRPEPGELLDRTRPRVHHPHPAAGTRSQPWARAARESMESTGLDEGERLTREYRRAGNTAAVGLRPAWRATS